MTEHGSSRTFYGWRVVGAAFVLAVFGWGLGFYGPPVYLHAVRETRGWPLALVSTAVTVHFLVGAIVIANLPKLYGRFGVLEHHQGWRPFARRGHHRVGDRTRALAALCCNLAQRRGLGCDGCCRRQCDHFTLVRTHTSGGAGHGLQWCKHRWHRVLPAVGGRDQALGLSYCSGGDRNRDGHHDLGSSRSDVLEDTAAHGFDAGRRCSPARQQPPLPRLLQNRC